MDARKDALPCVPDFSRENSQIEIGPGDAFDGALPRH